MAGEQRKVISYVADISDVLNKIDLIIRSNKNIAENLNKDLGNAGKVLGQGFTQLKDSFKFNKETGEFDKLTSVIDKSSQTIADADGNLFKVGQTIKTNAKGVASLSTSYENLGKNSKDLEVQQSSLAGKSSQLASNLNNVTDINQKFATQLKNTGNVSQVLARNLPELSGNILKTGAVVQTTDGKFLQLRETITRLPNGIQQVSLSAKDITKEFGLASGRTEELDKKNISLTENIGRLLKRAALTIPIWFAIRQGIASVVKTLKDGVKAIADFDRELQKLRKNLQGTPQEIERNFAVAKDEITKFSIESGRSTEEITKAIQRFATVGFDFETSMKAGIGATKLAIVLFGEGEETANAFARSMNVLVDRTDKLRTPAQQINEIFALTSELWEVNAFEISELNQGLEKFAGTSKALNLTADQTVTLIAALSTRGLNANRAGTLLRTSFLKLNANLSKTARVLGVEINPQLDTTFDAFRKVISAISELRSESGKISPDVATAINELFGGTRGGEPILDIISDLEQVNTTLDKYIGKRPDIEKFQEDFKRTNEQTFQLTARFTNLNKEIGKAFVSGLLGGDEFNKTMDDLIKKQDQIFKKAKLIGLILRAQFLGFNIDAIRDAKNEFIKQATESKKQTETKKETKKTEEEITKELKKRKQELEDQAEFEDRRQKINKIILENEIEKLKILGASEAQISKIRDSLISSLKIYEEEDDILTRQLETQRNINKEKRLQNSLSSDTVKLFRIAQTEGVKIAKDIGEVLSGQKDFNTFVRQGGKGVEILKRDFADLFEQQQANAFFSGKQVAGLPKLTGGGRIPISEEAQVRPPTATEVRIAAERQLLRNQNVETAQTNIMKVGSLQVANLNGFGSGIPGQQKLNPIQRLHATDLASTGFTNRSELKVIVTVDMKGNENVVVTTPGNLGKALEAAITPAVRKVIVDNIENNPQSQEVRALKKTILGDKNANF